jgi:tetratricopeptide (TPR) repeat protein
VQSDLLEAMMNDESGNANATVEEWLLLRVGALPRNSLGWFRCGVGFYNKKDYGRSIECFKKSVELDPQNARFKFHCS